MKNQISNDILLRILQNTYLFRVQEIDYLLTEIFFRYLNILDYINLQIDKQTVDKQDCDKKIETARAILYFIGYIYCEDFGRGAIERRLNIYDIDRLRFYEIVDRSETFDLSFLTDKEATLFRDIVEFYKMIKLWKNLVIPGYHLYLAEDYYNSTRERLYSSLL